jgi:hypothetical protein
LGVVEQPVARDGALNRWLDLKAVATIVARARLLITSMR